MQPLRLERGDGMEEATEATFFPPKGDMEDVKDLSLDQPDPGEQS